MDHIVQRAEFLQQKMGGFIGIAAGNGIIEQQFQHFMVGKTVQSLLQKLLLFPLSVAIMDTHGHRSFHHRR